MEQGLGRRSVRKHELDQRVAVLLGEKTSEISLVTECFLREALKALVEHRSVRLDGLGDLSLYIHPCKPYPVKLKNFDGSTPTLIVRRQYHLGFKKARTLREAIRERYGSAARKQKDTGVVATAV
jgi:nucleoid DNA-binding protein